MSLGFQVLHSPSIQGAAARSDYWSNSTLCCTNSNQNLCQLETAATRCPDSEEGPCVQVPADGVSLAELVPPDVDYSPTQPLHVEGGQVRQSEREAAFDKWISPDVLPDVAQPTHSTIPCSYS